MAEEEKVEIDEVDDGAFLSLGRPEYLQDVYMIRIPRGCLVTNFSFVIIFVVTVLLAALDFWVMKNVSGRILVGLRWWNEIDDHGESVWKFECLDQESLAQMNKKDSWLFWWTLYLTAVVWIFFGIFILIRFQADYLLVVGVCFTLSIANIVGFTKCRKDLPPGHLTDLRAAAVNNENFARVAVKHNLHVHLRHGSSALENQIRDFVKEVEKELSKPGFNSFGLGDCKALKVLGDIIESIVGAIFLDSERDTSVVWTVFQPLLHPMVTPETLPMHPVRELQERCQQQAEGLEYKATRNGNLATVEVFIDGVQVSIAQNAQKKMAQKLAARDALAALKDKEAAEAKEKENEDAKKKNGSQTFTRQTLNDICLRRNWPMPLYRCVSEGGPAHAKRFIFAVRVNTSDKGWTDECIGDPMPSVKKAKDSAAVLLLELLNTWYA